ncbi:MAG: asparaginyl/glutamyl-tRNA amidotransferase subunit C [Parcubacteria group bacterium CG1_02_39_15]|uniref:Aspartyl/glutamyl-tRNA(Asn/Gln) amidotransferase subunit C n=4 Tax=Candidatus Nealsoniibacteriota TaxID=1817911 RepID=A0A2H0MNT0_9BACT|nr:MAG: asparaginyl/glutamyl-tRNA amidotransferase subunit C [Parcubacteria group bacterium CG1_02_39_15]PIQ98309.1 MAG: Asp-tRNA(Asn)/Glu-tRNA(Gln) amidotransferase GatCAB subunit C [Candidatus Nealsonbacteria bacterium CG11_big_fil_rev_8_21_14_0_20_39_9]PIW89894.1 MAG: Asp-tRNA(Asn)/Glu-tRNA(Gln) amidotransferase GatCAB subunit C [Candidatus Nealsonbacteria bacterium CG_4_8_14_3_um_filter_40_11]PIZ88435.1 MAG: Asp-tRNA(Asn)/Glu-tRNA(Gln) amidotransferase GatCAB subunit C [Candidatus Nealsonbac
MITRKEVQHIAKLARLGLTEKEMGKFQKELSKILDYIEKLKKVNVSEVEPTSHSTKIENVMRADKSLKFKVQSSKLMELAPETKNGYLKVKSIF